MTDTPETSPILDDSALNGVDDQPAVGIISQYVKDLSVENPNAPESFQWPSQPQIDVQFNIGSRSVGPDVHEVELKISVSAKADEGTSFLIELVYAGLIGIRNLPDDQAHAFLFAEAPRILFPFARHVLANAVRDAGFRELLLEPIDFGGLYMQQRMQMEQAAAAQGEPAGNA